MKDYSIKINNKNNLIKILDWLYDTHKTTTDSGNYTERLSQYEALIDNCMDSGLYIGNQFKNCCSSITDQTHTDDEFIKEFIKSENIMEEIDLIDGQYYYCENTEWEKSFIFLKMGITDIKHINIITHSYLDKGWDFWTHTNSEKLRLATLEEKQWLEACIKANEFIPKEEALREYDQYHKSIIPTPIKVDLGDRKIWIGNDPELSKKIQEELFKLGYTWSSVTNYKALHINAYSLYLYRNHTLAYSSNNKIAFDSDKRKELFPEDLGISTIKSDEFVLPEKWYVVVTEENKQILTKWRERPTPLDINNIVGMCESIDVNGGPSTFSKEHNPRTRIKSKTFDFGEEITFEQFKKYVLKEDVKPMKKISEELKVNTWYKHKSNLNWYVYRTKDTYNSGFQKGKWSYIKYSCSMYNEWVEATKEEIVPLLFAEAKRRYPIGTEFKSAYEKDIATVKDFNFAYDIGYDTIQNSKGGWLYYQGKWAEIVKTASEPINKSEFKVGDWVTITKSNIDWIDSMDEFDGKTVQITEIKEFENIPQIRFKGDQCWTWRYTEKHFRPATPEEILSVTHTISIDPYEEWSKPGPRIDPTNKLEIQGTANYGIGMFEYPQLKVNWIQEIEPVKGIIKEVKDYSIK